MSQTKVYRTELTPLSFLERSAKIQWGLMITVYCISHVPALAERIRVGLQVQKDGNRSVVVEAS